MRKIFYCLMLGLLWAAMESCKDDEAAVPPKASFLASPLTTAVGGKIKFTINQVNANTVSLLPYGLAGNDAGVILTFKDGVTIVDFEYGKPGTFQAVVVSNNHTGDGKSVKSVQSDPISITITSAKSTITEFSFVRKIDNKTQPNDPTEDVSSKTVIDEAAKTIVVTVPYVTDVTKLKAAFKVSFSKVTLGTVEQVSGTTVNDFTIPTSNVKVYTVTAADGSTKSNYTVTVVRTPIQTINTIKSISAKAVSKSAKDKALGTFVDNVAKTIVIYDIKDTPSTQFDSVRVGYSLDGSLAILKYGLTKMKQDSMLDLRTSKQVKVFPQDSTVNNNVQTYTVYAAAAPKLASISFPGLFPDPAIAYKPDNFSYDIQVLAGTPIASLVTNITTAAAAGVTVTGQKANGLAFTNGDVVDYSKPVKFELTVTDANLGITYVVTYTVGVSFKP
jgi:hypothetical protein